MSVFKRIHWLASYPKSGNTWVRMFLQAYRFGKLDINHNDYVVTPDTHMFAWHKVSPCTGEKMDGEDLLMLRYAALLDIRARHTARPLIMKTHHSNVRITVQDKTPVELIPACMTQAAVYLVRDPRDVVMSYSRHVGLTIDKTIEALSKDGHRLHSEDDPTGSLSWLTSWSQHVKGWTEGGLEWFPRTVVRYEDMLSEPETSFSKILEAFEIKVSWSKVRRAIDMCRFDKLQKFEEKHGFSECSKKTGQFFVSGTQGQWQDKLTADQVGQIEKVHGEMMIKMGYELTTQEQAAA